MSIIEDAKDKDMFSAEYCRDGRRRIELKEGIARSTHETGVILKSAI